MLPKKEANATNARETFNYCRETGEIYWKFCKGKKKLSGKLAGNVQVNGYLYLNFCGKKYPAHRIIWLIATGNLPEGQIDHIDGNRLNNKIENLRDVTPSVNQYNKHKARKDSLSKSIGVYCKKGRWYAYMHVNKHNKSLGGYCSKADAEKARELFKLNLNKDIKNAD